MQTTPYDWYPDVMRTYTASRDWMLRAACREWPTLDFFPDPKSKPDQGVRDLCNACPVKDDCLQYAIGMEAALATPRGKPTRVGVWGGLTGQERAALVGRKARAKEVRPRLGFLCRNGHDRWKLRGHVLFCMECGCKITLTRKLHNPRRQNPCQAGHDNWKVDARGQLRCLACERIRDRKRKADKWNSMSPTEQVAFRLRMAERQRRLRLQRV